MRNSIKSLVGTIFAVLLVTSLITVLNPTVRASNYRVKVLIDSRSSYNENITDETGKSMNIFNREGMPGGTVTCRIFVTNTGDTTDTYTLSENSTWSSLSPISLVSVAPGETRQATLTVSIPSGATMGREENIKITATGLPYVGQAVNDNYVLVRVSKRLLSTNEDTYISSNAPSENKDATKPQTFYIGSFSSPFDIENGYLKFDLRGIAPSYNIPSARLWLYCYGAYPYDGYQGTFDVNWVENDNWDERNVNWDNNPGYDNLVAQETFSGLARYPDTWISFDVTSITKWERENGDNILSLCLRRDTVAENGASLSLRTKQYWDISKHPYLDVSGKAVGVNVDPSYRTAFAGGTFYYTVTVTNLNMPAAGTDNYNLTVTDNAGFGPILENTQLTNIAVGASKTTRVRVTIPALTPIGDNRELITVTVTSSDNAATGSDTGVAHVRDNLLKPADDDVMVSEGYPDNTNFGSRTGLELQSFTENYKNERIFLKYNLAGLPPENSVTTAILHFFCFNAFYDDIDAQIYTVSNDSWSEDNLTWHNQPAFGNLLDNITLSTFPTTDNQTYVSWDVTPYVAGQRLIDNMASFVIKASVENTSGRYYLDSKEWKNDNETPYLEIILGTPTNKIRNVVVSIADSATSPPAPIYAGPAHKIGDNGTTVDFTVKIVNMGNAKDNITLSSTDNASPDWGMAFDTTSFLNVNPGEGATTTLHVAIPSGAAAGAVDNIKVAAAGIGYTDNENCTVSVRKLNSWVVAGYSPSIDNYGTAVVGAGGYIYVANSNDAGTRANFMRYDPSSGGSWTYLATPWISSPFKNGTVLAWDNSNYIYALSGGSYADNADNSRARHYFWRYNISTNKWENLMSTGNTTNENSNIGAQGAGDALAVASGYVYALVGNRYIGENFWRYNIATNTWENRAKPWNNTDDGCSLVWTGGDNLYALQGENVGAYPLNKKFSRYSISGNSWTPLADILDGVGDGATLVWTGGDNIYANTGGDPVSELARDNFFRYSISGNSWTKLENVPKGIGDPNGPRMGVVGGNIFLWRSACNPTGEKSPVLWMYTLNIPPAGASISFVAGWNLVCFTAVGATDTPNNLFAPLEYYTDYWLYWWTAPGGPYTIQDPDTVLIDNLAYWVYINTSKTVKTTGAKPGSRTIYTVPGWNMVGFPVVNAGTTPNNKFAPLEYYTDYWLYWWTAPGGPYTIQDPDTAMLDNTGYWVYINTSKSVTVP